MAMNTIVRVFHHYAHRQFWHQSFLHGENDPVRRDTRYIQVLMSSVAFMADDSHKGSDADRRHGSRTSHDSQSVGSLPEVGGPLSPIEEGSESHVDSTDYEEALFDEEELRENPHLRDANMFLLAHGCVEDLVDTSKTQDDFILTEMHEQLLGEELDVVPNYHLISANIAAGLAPNFQLDSEEPCGLYFEGSAAKLIHERPREPDDD